MLSQLSYVPKNRAVADAGGSHGGKKVGARRFELRTSSLSGTRSNQLSYAPAVGLAAGKAAGFQRWGIAYFRYPGLAVNSYAANRPDAALLADRPQLRPYNWQNRCHGIMFPRFARRKKSNDPRHRSRAAEKAGGIGQYAGLAA